MTEVVLDASAVLCAVRNEAGADVVLRHMRGGLISTVNVGAVMLKLLDSGKVLSEVAEYLQTLELRMIDFEFEQAVVATSLRPFIKRANLSYADRACLALGLIRQLPVLTTDRIWGELDIGVDIHVIR